MHKSSLSFPHFAGKKFRSKKKFLSFSHFHLTRIEKEILVNFYSLAGFFSFSLSLLFPSWSGKTNFINLCKYTQRTKERMSGRERKKVWLNSAEYITSIRRYKWKFTTANSKWRRLCTPWTLLLLISFFFYYFGERENIFEYQDRLLYNLFNPNSFFSSLNNLMNERHIFGVGSTCKWKNFFTLNYYMKYKREELECVHENIRSILCNLFNNFLIRSSYLKKILLIHFRK